MCSRKLQQERGWRLQNGVVSIKVVREDLPGKSHLTRLEGNAAASIRDSGGRRAILAVSTASAKAKEAGMWPREGTPKRPPWLEGSERRKSVREVPRSPWHEAFHAMPRTLALALK